jgi:GT2 family glycosyltransferase
MKNPLVSIIIPVAKINDYVLESIPKILAQNYKNIEIIIFPDNDESRKYHFDKTRIIASGKCGPAVKRDLAIKYANGEILAFLDDDAYPKADWLANALKNFDNENVAAVGGPAVTPKSDDVWQKLSGTVFESYFGGGTTRNRYLPLGNKVKIQDWPTVNLLVRKDIFIKIGGFDNTFWPGEDTKLCLDIVNLGYDIIYDPTALVYHHRRSDLRRHFKQIGSYGLHRGHFARIYPATSRRLEYFLPSMFLGYVAFLISLFVILDLNGNGDGIRILFIPFYIFLIGVSVDGIVASTRWKNITLLFFTPAMIFLTHLWYGSRFIQGFFSKTLADSRAK